MPKFNKKNIENVSNDKPVVYTLKSGGGRVLYVGVAMRGQLKNRLSDHLGSIPAVEFTPRSYSLIAKAKNAEENKIKREKPKYNDQHK